MRGRRTSARSSASDRTNCCTESGALCGALPIRRGSADSSPPPIRSAGESPREPDAGHLARPAPGASRRVLCTGDITISPDDRTRLERLPPHALRPPAAESYVNPKREHHPPLPRRLDDSPRSASYRSSAGASGMRAMSSSARRALLQQATLQYLGAGENVTSFSASLYRISIDEWTLSRVRRPPNSVDLARMHDPSPIVLAL